MNDSQRSLLFWLLLLASPLSFLAVAQMVGEWFAGILAGFMCILVAFYLRAGREKK